MGKARQSRPCEFLAKRRLTFADHVLLLWVMKQVAPECVSKSGLFTTTQKGYHHTRRHTHMAGGQNQWYHFGVGAPPILVYFSGDWNVHWAYGILTHAHMSASSGFSLRATSCPAIVCLFL